MQSTIGKPAQEFRDFAAEARDTVKEFYRLNHAHQTLEFVLAKKADYLARNRKRLGVWDALEFLDTVVDDSDPDVDFTQIDHALQTAEAVRRAGSAPLAHRHRPRPRPREDPLRLRRAAMGRRRRHFPGRLPVLVHVRLPRVLRREPRSGASDLLDAVRDLRAELRARQRPHVVGTRRVHLPRRQGLPPVEALYALRYHSFYPWHKEGAYDHLATDQDREMLKWVKAFNRYDLYSKGDGRPDARALRPYYEDLIAESSPSRFSSRNSAGPGVLKCGDAEVQC
jgi:inositol oxygenase